MYSTDLRDQFFSAALPLKPLVAWCGSACSVTVAVPPAPAIASLQISTVAVSLTLPDRSVVSAWAVARSGTPLWTATFPASAFATAGNVAEGFEVALGGKDERGETRTWIVAKGDLEVKSGDATPTPGESYYLVKLRDSAPANPVKGDAYVSGGKLYIYSDGEWTAIGTDVVPPSTSASAAGKAADAKATGDALYGGFTPWVFSGVPSGYSCRVVDFTSNGWEAQMWEDGSPGTTESAYDALHDRDTLSLAFVFTIYGTPVGVTATRHLVTPTKTSQLTNDGAPNGGGTPYATTAQVAAKQDALSEEQLANIAAVPGKANAADVNAALALKANATDLPYAMVTPGEWTFSDGVDRTLSISEVSENIWVYYYTISGNDVYSQEQFATQLEAGSALSLTFEDSGLTATRASLPGHLLDRANNLIDAQTGNVTLTLPPFVAGKVRDLLVACTIGLDANDEPWSVIFQGAYGEEISFKAEGDDASIATFPVPTAAGDWWYSFTERAPHLFAVSLKQLQSVSQQGGV